MEQIAINSVSIIGFGRLGKLFLHSLQKAGVKTIDVLKKGDSFKKLNSIVIICVPDTEIEVVARQIVNVNAELNGKLICHCSGTVAVSKLESVADKGAQVGCLHPMMAVTESSKTFEGVTFDVCGTEHFLNQAISLCKMLGAFWVVVTEAQKQKLHIASVIASNYLVTLFAIAEQIGGSDQTDQVTVKKALLTLMQSALNNLQTSSPEEALTGPIARGDSATISDHLGILQNEHINFLDVYKSLGNATVDLARDQLTMANQELLKQLFDGNRTK